MVHQLFYVGQKAFIDKGGQVLVLLSPDFGLDFPGGRIQEGETNFTDSLKREVREETALEIEQGDAFFTWFNLGSNSRNARKKIYLVGFRCFYVSGEVALSKEHSEHMWVNADSYKKLDDGSDYFKVLEKYFLASGRRS